MALFLRITLSEERNQDLRVYWFRTHATSERWTEELKLVEEEMKRTVRFFDYYYNIWIQRAEVHERNGALASASYAHK